MSDLSDFSVSFNGRDLRCKILSKRFNAKIMSCDNAHAYPTDMLEKLRRIVVDVSGLWARCLGI